MSRLLNDTYNCWEQAFHMASPMGKSDRVGKNFLFQISSE